MATSVSEWIPFEEVEQHVQQYMHHPFLRVSRISQSVSRFHFDVGCVILKAANAARDEALQVLAAVLLLHQGLSIHNDVTSGVDDLRRQLIVLAGDYDSSRYYWILSRLDNAKLLSALCEGVVKINEAKMSMISLQDKPSPEVVLSLQETIHGSLLFALADTYLHGQDELLTHIRWLVQAYVLSLDTLERKTPSYFTVRQAYGLLTDALERVLRIPNEGMLGPIGDFVKSYLSPLIKALEQRTFVEGKRP